MRNSGFGASTKSGLARIRKLTAKSTNSKLSSRSEISDLPNGDYFNEKRAKQIWDEIERKDDTTTNDIQTQELKRTEAVSDLQDTSGKIRTLVSKFDDIDQETLMSLLEIYDDKGSGSSNEQLDTSLIMNDSKTQVTDLILKLNDLSASEHTMIETLKFWFNSLQKRSEDTGIDIGDIPNVDDVVDGLEKVVQDYTEKSEKAVCIHNDITDFMFKQFSKFKRALLNKDEQIKKLQKTIDDNAAAAAERRRRQKKMDEKQNEEGIKKEQFDAQIRLNLELKKQVQELKQSLQTSEVQRLALVSLKDNERGNSKELIEANADIANLRIENEALSNMYLNRITDLNKQIQDLNNKLKEADNKNNSLTEKIKKRDNEIAQLESELQKQLHLNSIAQSQMKSIPGQQVDNSKIAELEEEKHLLMLKHDDEIKEIQDRFRQDLKAQLDYQRQQFAIERQGLINTMGTPDSQKLLAAIQDNCNRQIEDLQKENEKIRENALSEMSRKLALLTRQYEHRIKNINTSHSVEMNMTQSSLEYEKKKFQIEQEEKYHQDYLKLEKENEAKLDEYRKYIEKLEKKNEKLMKDNESIKKALTDLYDKTGISKNVFVVEGEESGDNKSEGLPENLEKGLTARDQSTGFESSESYSIKYKILKEELEKQMRWEIQKMKVYYEHQMKKMAAEQQKDLRENLLNLQEKMTSMNNGDKVQEISDAVNNISSIFAAMNDQLGEIDESENDPTITIDEHNEKTKSLTERIIKIRQDYETAKLANGHGDIENLTRELEMYKSLSKGDQDKLQKQIDEIYRKHKEELDDRDKMIEELTKITSETTTLKKPVLSYSDNIVITEREEMKVVEEIPKTPIILQSAATTPVAITPVVTRPRTPVQSKFALDSVVILNVDSDNAPRDIPKSESIPTLAITSPKQISISGRSNVLTSSFPIDGPDSYESSPLDTESVSRDEEVKPEVRKNSFTLFPSLQSLSINGKLVDYTEKYNPIVMNPATGRLEPRPEPKMVLILSYPNKSTVDIPEIEYVIEEEEVVEEEVKEKEEEPKPETKPTTPPKPKVIKKQVIKKTYREAAVQVKEEVKEKPHVVIKETPILIKETPAVLTTSDAVMNVNIPQEISSKGLKLSSSLLQTIEDDPRDIEITSKVNSFHVSEVPSPRKEKLVPELTFSGEKYNEPELKLSNNESIFTNEPEMAVYTSICNSFDLQIPYLQSKLEEVISSAFESIEPNVDVIIKSPELMGEKYEVVSFEQFDINTKRKEISKEISISSFNEKLFDDTKEKLTKMLDGIKHAAIERYERLMSKYTEEIGSLKEQLSRKTDIVVIKDTNLEELKPPVFSNKNKGPIDAKKMGIPIIKKEDINKNAFVVDKIEPAPKVEEKKQEEEEEVKEKETKAEEEETNEQKPTLDSFKESKHQSQFLLQNISIPGVDINADPFGSCFKIASAQLKELKEYIDQDEEFSDNIDGDTSAYFAYISAAGMKDQSHYSFINSLKDSKGDHDNARTQLFYIQNLTMFLSKCMTNMKNKYNKLEDEYQKFKDAHASEEVKLQQELLHDLQNRVVDQNTSVEMQQLDTLHKLQNSLSMLTDLGLVKTPEQEEEHEKLFAKIKGAIARVSSESHLTDAEMDKCVADVQMFISTLNNNQKGSPRDENVENLKSDCYRLRKERNQLRKNLKNEKLKTEGLEIQVDSLKNRLAEAKESSLSESLMTQAQLNNLKNSIKATNEASGDSAKEIFTKQMLNMVALLDASNAEKNMLHNKVDDLEDIIAQSNEREKKAQAQIRELLENSMDIHRNNSSSVMFKDIDIEHLQEQIAADAEVASKQRVQLEEATATNTQLLAANSTLEEELFQAKSEARQLQLQLDEISYNATMKNVKPQEKAQPVKKISYATKCIQKNFDPSMFSTQKKTQEPVKVAKMSDEQLLDSVLINSIEKMTVKPITPTNVPEKKEIESLSEDKIPEITEEEEEATEEEENIPLSTYASKENIFVSKDSLSDDNNHDDFFGDELIQTQCVNPMSFDDMVPHLVHDPLMLPKKPKIKIPLANTTLKSQRPLRHRINTTSIIPSLPRNDDVNISINNAPQGKRQVTGLSRQIKPTTNISDTTAVMIAASSRRPEGGIPIITSTFSFNQLPGLQPPTTIPAGHPFEQQPIVAAKQRPYMNSIDKTLELAPPAPVRITLIKPNEVPDDRKLQKTPIVIKKPPLSKSSDHPEVLAIKGARIQKSRESREVKETIRLNEKLRADVRRLSAQNESLEKTIMQLKQKISEMTLQLHRSKLDIIRANDEKRKTQIKADNVKARLDICYNEVAIRDDEIIKLKRQIIILKNATAPINEIGTKVMQARIERERIKREKEQKAQMKNATEKALMIATNEATAKHLATLLVNTKNSIARLESKRRMWKEIEQKQAMAVLGAMSLLSTSEVSNVKNSLPEYSPFKSNRLSSLREILNEQRESKKYQISQMDTTKAAPEKEFEPTYSEKVAILDKIKPPLTDEERRDVILRKESPEISERIIAAIKSEKANSSIASNTCITPAAI